VPVSDQRSRPGILLLKGNYGLAGGPETLIASMARHIDRSRFEPALVVLRREGVPESPHLSAEQLPISRTDIGWSGVTAAPLTAMKLRRLVQQRGALILHTHDMRANLVAWLLKRTHHIRWVAHVHGWLGPTQTGKWRWYEALDQRLVRGADLVVVGSSAAMRDVKAVGVRSVAVVPNAIEIPPVEAWKREAAEARSALNLGSDTIAAGIVGRVHPGKGHRFLLQAIARLRSCGRDIRGIIVGDGPDLGTMRGLAAELGIADAVHFAGFRTNATPLVRAMDIFVAPSLKESMPLAVLEAMALGRPVVASRTGDLPLIIEDGYNGLLVPPGDPDAIADAIDKLARSRELRATLGEQARRTVESQFSAETMSRKLEAIYLSILNETAAWV
jgi:glycosyltransferase involved in cell wall biosynthesis